MLVPVRLPFIHGLLIAAIPLLAMGGFGLAMPPITEAGAEPWCIAGSTAGLYGILMWLGIVGVTLGLSMLLSMGTADKHAPLVLLVGLATMPWLLGVAGTQEAMRQVLVTLPSVGGRDALEVLAAGTGEAMMARLVGAWSSAALLSAVTLGLLLLYKQARRAGEGAGRLIGAALSLALAVTALLAAYEAHLLMQMLTPLVAPASGVHAEQLAILGARLSEVHGLRSALLGMLAVLGLTLVGWQFFPSPRAVNQWAGSLALVAIAATVLVLDTRPLQLAARGAWKVDASHLLLPSALHDTLATALGATRLPAPALRTEP
ncbi:MAG: hypothetical protein ABW123_11875 [Cystobacter sp.]